MNLYLNEQWKRIGISLSGGADSAILAYLICQKRKCNYRYTFYFTNTLWKTRPWQGPVVDGVIDWFKNRFDNNFYST